MTIYNRLRQVIRGDGNLTKCDVLFFCHDADRPISLSGRAYAPLIDSLREEFERKGYKCISIAHFGSIITGNKGFGFPISMERSKLKFAILNRIFKSIPLLHFKFNIYSYILEKTKPKLVITIGAPIMLCEAASFKGLIVIEVLHGIGYKSIPWGWDKLSSSQLPKVILSLDQVSTNSFLALEKKGVKLFTIPNPFLKRFTDLHRHMLPREWCLTIENFSFYKKVILVSLVWGYTKADINSPPEFSNILQNGLFYDEIADLVRERRDIFWCFRLHPVQIHSAAYKGLRIFLNDFVETNYNSEWKMSSTLPFPTVAMSCQGNISMSSMSCYDAAAFGVTSLLLCPQVQKGAIYESWFNDLESEGYVCKMPVNKSTIEKWVDKVKKRDFRLSNLHDEESWIVAMDWMLKESGLDKYKV